MKVLITGGHLTPALAVLQHFKKSDKVLFVGRKHPLEGDSALSLEYQVCVGKGISFKDLLSGRLQRKFTIHTLPSLLKIPLGFLQAFYYVATFRPEVILSFGSYVSFPVEFCGFLLGVPIVIHEQTLGAGLTNRITSPLARTICISWESSRRFFPKEKTVFTGNPIREEIFKKVYVRGGPVFGWRSSDRELPTIYITGGSLGAHAINIAVEEIIEKLLERYVVVHQTGDAKKYKDFERLCDLRNTLGGELRSRYILVRHIEDEIGWVLRNATLVVSRAGANTVTELLALGKPALLIPLPIAADSEQAKNAKLLRDVGLGEEVAQEKLSGKTLANRIQSMMDRIGSYEKSGRKAKKLVRLNAAEDIVRIVYHAVEGTKTKAKAVF